MTREPHIQWGLSRVRELAERLRDPLTYGRPLYAGVIGEDAAALLIAQSARIADLEASLSRDRDGSGEAGQTAKQAGPKATARAEGIAQTLPPQSDTPHD